MRDYLAQRASHIADATPGTEAARQLCRLTDEAVRELARAASSAASPPRSSAMSRRPFTRSSSRWAVVALGGWGSGALLPDSDLDVLILCESNKRQVKQLVEALLYPLWDSGLKVGHQVRSPKEQLRAAGDDIKTLTAMLTSRPIAGDIEWAEAALLDCVRTASKRAASRLSEIQGRERPGTPFALEPDLKNEAGGRRDYDELIWTASILESAPRSGVATLVGLGLMTDSEAPIARDAAEVISAARWVLQRDGWGDRLTADGPLDEAGQQAVQKAVIDTSLVLSNVRRRIARETVGNGRVTLAELFAGLDRGEAAFPELCDAASAGRLDGLVPGMREMMALRRPGLGHELTVGAHCIRAACLVRVQEDDTGPLGQSARASERRTLQIAALLHDIGKRSPEPGHAERGAYEGFSVATPLLGETRAAAVRDLVRSHLLLAETATTSNLDDEDSVLGCAARLRDPSLVAGLHVLTAVDSIATGASTWTAWRAALVASLVTRLTAALSPEVDGAGIADLAEKNRAAVLREMHDSSSDERSFVQLAPMRYLASHRTREIVEHARLVGQLLAKHGSQAVLAIGAQPAVETHRLTVAAIERPDLLSRLAGAMSLAGLDILNVDAFLGPASTAVHNFVVRSATDRPVTAETYARLERMVGAAMQDRLGLEARIQQRRVHYPTRSTGPVVVRVDDAGLETLLRVTAPDRVGLLYDISRAVEQAGLEIRWASAETIDGIANDVFRISGPDGGPPERGPLGHACARIRELV